MRRSLSQWLVRRPTAARRRVLKRVPVAAEVLEDRVLLVGDAFNTELEGTIAGNITAQVVGNFDGVNGDDIASFDASTSRWLVSLNDGAGNFVTTQWDQFPTIGGWTSQLVEDFNGDGFDDIAQFSNFNGTWWVSLAVDGPDAGAVPDSFNTQLWADLDTNFWDTQVSGDFNGDGQEDLAQFSTFNGTWWVSLNNGAGAFVTTQWDDFGADSGWQSQIVGDFDGDGSDDIANYSIFNGTWWVSLSEDGPDAGADEDRFVTTQWEQFGSIQGWVAQLVGDFNGDGADDIANFSEFNNTWWVASSQVFANGVTDPTNFETNLWATLPTGDFNAHVIGDFNGTAGQLFADDVASFDATTGRWYAGISSGGIFEVDVWSDFQTTSGWTFQQTGDFGNIGIDDGIIQFNTINNSLWRSVPTFGALNGTDVAIPDTTTVESQIVIAGLTGTILDVNVRINLTHTFLADLNVILISPTGIEMELFTDIGGGNVDLDEIILDDEAVLSIAAFSQSGPFPEGRFSPEGDLNDVDGLNPNGTWTLRITDDGTPDVGNLDFWELNIKTTA